MRLATIRDDGRLEAALIEGVRVLPLADSGLTSVREIAAGGSAALDRVMAWGDGAPADAWRPLDDVEFGPAIPDPGAIYTIGLNYAPLGGPDSQRPERPLVYGKLPTSVAADGAILAWDRALTPNVDAECELGVVVGPSAEVFGYTIVNDVSSRDPWLDGDQWLLGKSMAGFCPVGPWIVTDVDPADLDIRTEVNGDIKQHSRTSLMIHDIGAIIEWISAVMTLLPGDLILTGTPEGVGPIEDGDTVSITIEGIGTLSNPVVRKGK